MGEGGKERRRDREGSEKWEVKGGGGGGEMGRGNKERRREKEIGGEREMR